MDELSSVVTSEEDHSPFTGTELLKILYKSITGLKDTIDEQNKKIEKLSTTIGNISNTINNMLGTINNMETKIVQQNAREVNRAIRKYATKGNVDPPITFVPTRTSISKLFK